MENEVAFFATVTPHDVDHLVRLVERFVAAIDEGLKFFFARSAFNHFFVFNFVFFPHLLCCHLQGQKQNIVFDNAVTNIGNGYHPLHGIFTAPVEGTYVFAVTVSGISPNGTYYCYLDVNGEAVSKFVIHRYEQSSHLAIVHLKTGNDVSVKNSNIDEHILGDKYTAFSGFLLYQTYEYEPSVDVVG